MNIIQDSLFDNLDQKEEITPDDKLFLDIIEVEERMTKMIKNENIERYKKK